MLDNMPEKVSFLTSDGVTIFGNVYQGKADRFVIFLHMMPSTKEGWNSLARRLADENNVTSMAIDERGHGESTMNGQLDFHAFTEEQQRAKILDVEAAFVYLQTLGATEENTIIVGGSIGANLAIWFLTLHPGIKRAIALSPGLLYRGVSTDDKIVKLESNQHVLLVASDDDTHSAYEGSQELHRLNPNQTELILYKGAGHAEAMLAAETELNDIVAKWVTA